MNIFVGGGSDAVPAWLQIAEAVGQALGALGVLIALIAFGYQWYQGRDDRDQRAKDAQIDRERHEAQLAAFRQAEDDRLAAQARRVVPQIFSGNVFKPTLWNVRVDNWSPDAISIIKIDIVIVDTNGNDVSHGYRLANRQTLGETMIATIMPEFNAAIDALTARYMEFIEQMRNGALSLIQDSDEMRAINASFEQASAQLGEQINSGMMQAQVNHAVQTQLTDEWPSQLGPSRFAAIAIDTTRADYRVHLRIVFEDASGYRWVRTDTEGPKRIHEPTQ
nr:hypothetical protein [Mycolicibacterium komanii]CRL70342.1 hypothetical protein CPGR_01950 [Mycolicibacterium komanii]